MKSLFALFIFTVIIPGCGTLSTATKYSGPTYIEPELRPVMEQWATECRQHLEHSRCDTAGIRSITRVEKYEDNPNTVGQCRIKIRGVEEIREITIKREISVDGYYMRAIMLHEMMHCRMGFERHADVGLMGEEMINGEWIIEAKWPELLEETYSLVK